MTHGDKVMVTSDKAGNKNRIGEIEMVMAEDRFSVKFDDGSAWIYYRKELRPVSSAGHDSGKKEEYNKTTYYVVFTFMDENGNNLEVQGVEVNNAPYPVTSESLKDAEGQAAALIEKKYGTFSKLNAPAIDTTIAVRCK